MKNFLICAVLALSACTPYKAPPPDPIVCRHLVVTKVESCKDSWGGGLYCGVMYEDGTHDTESYPVVGSKVKVCRFTSDWEDK